MSRWEFLALRCGGADLNGRVWTPDAARSLCALAEGGPVRAHLAAPGMLAHPTGRALESVIRPRRAGLLPPRGGDSPRALVVEHGMRAMAARGELHLLGCSVLVDRRRFSAEAPGRPVVIRQVLAWTALDLVTNPAIGGRVLRPLEPGENPEPADGSPHDG